MSWIEFFLRGILPIVAYGSGILTLFLEKWASAYFSVDAVSVKLAAIFALIVGHILQFNAFQMKFAVTSKITDDTRMLMESISQKIAEASRVITFTRGVISHENGLIKAVGQDILADYFKMPEILDNRAVANAELITGIRFTDNEWVVLANAYFWQRLSEYCISQNKHGVVAFVLHLGSIDVWKIGDETAERALGEQSIFVSLGGEDNNDPLRRRRKIVRVFVGEDSSPNDEYRAIMEYQRNKGILTYYTNDIDSSTQDSTWIPSLKIFMMWGNQSANTPKGNERVYNLWLGIVSDQKGAAMNQQWTRLVNRARSLEKRPISEEVRGVVGMLQ